MTKEIEAIIEQEMIEWEEYGKVEGLKVALLIVLSSKGKLSEELVQEIRVRKERKTLEKWIRKAATAEDVEEFEDQVCFW